MSCAESSGGRSGKLRRSLDVREAIEVHDVDIHIIGVWDAHRYAPNHGGRPRPKSSHIFGALAEFERALVFERPLTGLAATRAQGRTVY